MKLSKYLVQEITVKKDWEEFVLSQNPQSFLQSWNWGETNLKMGHKVFRLGFLESNKLVGVAQIIEERARRGPYFLIPGGPLLNWSDKNLVRFVLGKIHAKAKEQKVWFIRIRPEVLDKKENRNLFAKLGFVPAPMHLHAENTWVLNLKPSEEELLAGMRKTTRYLIRQSLTKGLTIETSVLPQDTSVLTKLQEETVLRHNFVGFSQKLFEGQLETFGKDDQALLFICKKGKEALAAAIIIFYGDCAYYHHSGSTGKYRNLPFSYFLQWRIILHAKSRGFKGYNFWGIAPDDDPKHRFAGVTTFKKGFGGERIDWLRARDLPTSPLYWLTFLFEQARKRLRRL